MIDADFFEELKDLYKQNVRMFAEQNSGYFIEKVNPLTIDIVESAFNTNAVIDKKYIQQHFVNFTINPQVTEIQKGYTTRIEISPDVSWEVKKSGKV